MRSLVLLPLFAALLSATAVAQIPRTISFQGRAETATGPVTGQRNVTIKIWNAPTGGTAPLFIDAPQQVQFTDGGVFAMAIGANAPGGVPDSLFDRPLWVGISIQGVNGNTEFTPRYALHASPYTFRARMADAAVLADSTRSIPWQLGDGTRDRAATLDITNVIAGGSKTYAAALHVKGSPYAIVSEGVDSVDGHVVVSQEAQGNTPAPGALYRDNVPVAWGTAVTNVSAGVTEILADFGIDSVVSGEALGGIAYRVYMQRAVKMRLLAGQQYPQIAVTVTPIISGQDGGIRAATWAIAPNATGAPDASSFYVIIRDSSGRNISGSFSFQVFGLLP